jgi:hypothetical protein
MAFLPNFGKVGVSSMHLVQQKPFLNLFKLIKKNFLQLMKAVKINLKMRARSEGD